MEKKIDPTEAGDKVRQAAAMTVVEATWTALRAAEMAVLAMREAARYAREAWEVARDTAWTAAEETVRSEKEARAERAKAEGTKL